MTSPRISTTRELFGLLGRFPEKRTVQKNWNHFFKKEGMDASMNCYPTIEKTIPERLSEMFLFDRRAYLISEELQSVILSYLDALDSSAQNSGKVDTIINHQGVFTGYYLSTRDPAVVSTILTREEAFSSIQ